ncbi:hypothetical protein BDR06DRAFT_252073 [Suillus hirtellus]|nr:hypothetical protein BDR06DRAFT_252073 [Suillus hirtellus]
MVLCLSWRLKFNIVRTMLPYHRLPLPSIALHEYSLTLLSAFFPASLTALDSCIALIILAAPPSVYYAYILRSTLIVV